MARTRIANNFRPIICQTICKLLSSGPLMTFEQIELQDHLRDKARLARDTTLEVIDALVDELGIPEGEPVGNQVAEEIMQTMRVTVYQSLDLELPQPPLTGSAKTQQKVIRPNKPDYAAMKPAQLLEEMKELHVRVPRGSLRSQTWHAEAVALCNNAWRARHGDDAPETPQTPESRVQVSDNPPVTPPDPAYDPTHTKDDGSDSDDGSQASAEDGDQSDDDPATKQPGTLTRMSDAELDALNSSDLRELLAANNMSVPDGNIQSKAWRQETLQALRMVREQLIEMAKEDAE